MTVMGGGVVKGFRWISFKLMVGVVIKQTHHRLLRENECWEAANAAI